MELDSEKTGVVRRLDQTAITRSRRQLLGCRHGSDVLELF
jgi:hypothetical protein